MNTLEYEVQGNYGSGWELVDTCETMTEARRSLEEYNENEPQYSHRIIKRRVTKIATVPTFPQWGAGQGKGE